MKIRYSFALLCLFAASIAQAQTIPNGSFEQWDSEGNPEGWLTSNSEGAAVPITQSTMHVDGQFSAEGRVIDFLGFPYPPVLTSGNSLEETPGFPLNGRPEALNGFIAGQLNGGDVVQIIVLIGKTDDYIGTGAYTVTSLPTGLTAFSIPINYTKSGNGDSAVISVQLAVASQQASGSVYYVDDFKFGAATSSVKQEGELPEFTVTRSSRYNEIAFEAYGVAFSTLEILDMHGRTVETLFSGVADHHRMRWEGRGLANGVYFARLTRPEGIEMRKFILNR